MNKVLRCDCGLSIVVVTEEDLVAEARKHAREIHHMEFSPEDVLALVRPDDRPAEGFKEGECS